MIKLVLQTVGLDVKFHRVKLHDIPTDYNKTLDSDPDNEAKSNTGMNNMIMV